MHRALMTGWVCLIAAGVSAQEPTAAHEMVKKLKVPPGFVVEVAAAPPVVKHPMMGHFDERGRLFLAESAGKNLDAKTLLKEFPNKVLVLDPADERGVFRNSQVFADKMTFPSGALPYRGSVYVTAAPSIWQMTEGEKGTAIARKEVVTKFGFIGNAADLHGPYLGPDGWIYWCDGRHGHEIERKDGSKMQGKAARIFRCRPDGRDVEVVCGGGFDNPVKIAFTEEGEPLVTVDILHNRPARNDGIIFGIEGGNYPYHDVSRELPRTGDLLPAVENLGWVAPSGIIAYRGEAFGSEYRNVFFTAQFNRSRVQRHQLTREGAGFRMKTVDFLTCDDKNFHPTDILEDADGSLLIVETGGWFRIGCPTSQIARPEITGAIYRVRKQDAKPVVDPRGLRIAWDKASVEELIRLTDDPRVAVRDRAIDTLALRGEAAVKPMRTAMDTGSERLQRNLIWALSRQENAKAREAVRERLTRDVAPTVLLAAAHVAGLHRDGEARPHLVQLLRHDKIAVRRQAATALGRLRDARAVPELVAMLDAVKQDRFLEHAVIHALLAINDGKALAPFLQSKSVEQQRGVVIALGQVTAAESWRGQLVALASSPHAAVARAAVDEVAARPAWSADLVALSRRWLTDPSSPGTPPADRVRDVLAAISHNADIQALIAKTLQQGKLPGAYQVALLETLERTPMLQLSKEMTAGLAATLTAADDAVVERAILVVTARASQDFDPQLSAVARDAQRGVATRLMALQALAPRLTSVTAELFDLLTEQLSDKVEPLTRLAAAKALARMKLDNAQRTQLLAVVPRAGPLELPLLLSSLEPLTAEQAPKLLAALDKAPGFPSLLPGQVQAVFAKHGEAVQVGVKTLVKRLDVDVEKQHAKLNELEKLSTGGDEDRGKQVFFGTKAICSACHVAQGQGGRIGPELSKIGAIRTARDLLESIVFPSASFAREYEPIMVETKAGRVLTGVLSRETADAIVITTTDRLDVTLARGEVVSLTPSRVSIMPAGLETQLQADELRDLLAYLRSLK